IADQRTLDKLYNLLKDVQNNGLGFGMKSPQIQQIKKDLMKVGFGTHWSNPTTYFGKDTEKVVLEFQNYYSLHENGKIDDKSLSKLNEMLSSPYQKGKRSDEVLQVKQDLMEVGFGTHWKNPTTLYGSDTEKVVKEFQQSYNLVVNGIAD